MLITIVLRLLLRMAENVFCVKLRSYFVSFIHNDCFLLSRYSYRICQNIIINSSSLKSILLFWSHLYVATPLLVDHCLFSHGADNYKLKAKCRYCPFFVMAFLLVCKDVIFPLIDIIFNSFRHLHFLYDDAL